MSAFWDKIDGILIINLRHREDRWEQITQQLAEFAPVEKIHRIDAVLGVELAGYGELPWFREETDAVHAKMRAGAAGCCLSHRKAIQFAKDQGMKNVLILEDDAYFLNDFCGDLGAATALALEREEWDMFYLAFYQRHQLYWTKEVVAENEKMYELQRIRGPISLHSLVMRNTMFDVFLQELPSEKEIWKWIAYWGSIDSWIVRDLGRRKEHIFWGIHPRAVEQRTTFSDIVGDFSMDTCYPESKFRKFETVEDFSRMIPRSFFEKAYQAYKRNARVLKNYLRGYH